MKKITSIMMILCLCLGMNVYTYAADESNNIVPIEDYISAVKEENNKYGIECEIIDYDDNIIITKSMMEQSIKNIRKLAENMNSAYQEEEFYDDNDANEANVLRSMPIKKTVSKIFVVENIYGNAGMCVEADVTLNAQNGNVISVDRTEAYQKGQFTNFVSWQTTSISSTRNSPSNGYITLVVKGRAMFQYSDPLTGLTTGNTTDVSKTLKINCN